MYAQVDDSRPLMEGVRVFGHLGGLRLLSSVPDENSATRHQFDIRAGGAARWSSVTVQLSWVGVNQVARVYPVGNYEGAVPSGRSAWVLQMSVSF